MKVKNKTRKMYASEFLIRSKDEDMVSRLKVIAAKRRMSVNGLILSAIDGILGKQKKSA